jgi:hypothetical protein
MKYLLILHLCSIVTQTCPNMMYPKQIYNSWVDCATAGYQIAGETFKKVNKDIAEIKKLAIKFECKQVSST